jgi:glycosyltransferase involved in cell wall biosynthesis
VISTNTYGIPYTVQNDKNGILVEPDNPNDLSNAIIKLLDNSELRDRLGSEGYNFVHSECNCITMAKKTLHFFEKILKNQNKYKQK